jgi:hypothetical protein
MKNLLSTLVVGNEKALVPLMVLGGLTVLGMVGISGDMTVKEALTLGGTAVLVWLTRNRK